MLHWAWLGIELDLGCDHLAFTNAGHLSIAGSCAEERSVWGPLKDAPWLFFRNHWRGLVRIFVVIAISGLSIVCAALILKALIDFRETTDVTWTLATAPFVSLIEICVALITSSIPVIYPLFIKSGASLRYSKGPKVSKSQPEIRWTSRGAQGSGMLSPKTHTGWKFGLRKGDCNEAEMHVLRKESLNAFREIPSTTQLHETGASSVRGHTES